MVGLDLGRTGQAPQPAIVAQLELQFVGQVDELEHRLQLVVAVRSPAHHVQEQVQLGRRRPRRAAHGPNSQRLSDSFTRDVPCCRSTRAGNRSSPTTR